MLTVEGLSIAFGAQRVVDDVSFDLAAGETLALVGESGSGKSLTALSALRLLPANATAAGRITVDGQDVLAAGPRALQRIRGGTAGIVFQEPMTSLNPLQRIGHQVGEAIALQRQRPRRQRLCPRHDARPHRYCVGRSGRDGVHRHRPTHLYPAGPDDRRQELPEHPRGLHLCRHARRARDVGADLGRVGGRVERSGRESVDNCVSGRPPSVVRPDAGRGARASFVSDGVVAQSGHRSR